jgi:hypothetical protein
MAYNFLHFFENALASRVGLRVCILVVGFCLSAWEVLTLLMLGSPKTGVFLQPMHSAGEYRVSLS